MATPIKDTPVLEGKTSRRFNALLKANEGATVSKERILAIRELTKKVLSTMK